MHAPAATRRANPHQEATKTVMLALKTRLAARLRSIAALLDPPPKATMHVGTWPPGYCNMTNGTGTTNVPGTTKIGYGECRL
jgi:hypothetical protein